eukprot:369589-Prorocentrum_minimum.AAC.1
MDPPSRPFRDDPGACSVVIGYKQVAFYPDGAGLLLYILNFIIDIAFLMDILVNFNTAFQYPDSDIWLKEHDLIAKEYLRGRYVSLVASVRR